MLALAAAHWGELSTTAGLALVAASYVPAWLSYRLVENPVRHARTMALTPGFALSVGANLTLLGVVAGLVLSSAVTSAGAGVARPGRSRARLRRPTRRSRRPAGGPRGVDHARTALGAR